MVPQVPQLLVSARERTLPRKRNGSEAWQASAKPGYPVTRNDAGAADCFFRIADAAFGPERVERVPEAFLGGEDFSYYGACVPSCFFLLGLKPRGAREMPQLHQPDFDFNDDALAVGVEAMVRLALES